MSYLEEFGVAQARRERLLKRLIGGVAAGAVLAGILWFMFRDYSEKRRVTTFLEYVRQGDYKAAYAMWGCTVETPCRDYSFEKFIEDWGPEGYGDVKSVRVGSERSCDAGIIQTLEFGEQDVYLWVGRADGILSYAPWDTCNPHFVPSSTP